MRKIRRRLKRYYHSNRQPLLTNHKPILSLEQLESRLLLSTDLPGMHLVDPSVDHFDGQIVYLDFDGEDDVAYNGPVTIDGINVPTFRAPGILSGQEQEIIDQVLQQLVNTFEGSGLVFTTERPAVGTEYSTIYIGGDNHAFSPYGTFQGIAETIDIGNHIQNDNAFVFSDYVPLDELAETTAHEIGHLLGYAHADDDTPGDNISDYVQDYKQSLMSNENNPTYGSYSKSITVDKGSTHRFIVDGVWGTSESCYYKWYSSDSGTSGFLGSGYSDSPDWTDPTIGRTFNSTGSYVVRAEIWDKTWTGIGEWWEAHRWYVTVLQPNRDPTISDIYANNITSTSARVITSASDLDGNSGLQYRSRISEQGSISYGPWSSWSSSDYVNYTGLKPNTGYDVEAEVKDPSGSTASRDEYNYDSSCCFMTSDPNPTASRVPPTNSSITIPFGTNQGFTVRGDDAGGDLWKVVWNLTGAKSYTETDDASDLFGIEGHSDTADFTDWGGYTFDKEGDYNLTATVYDDSGDTAAVSWSIHVNPQPKPDLIVTQVTDTIASYNVGQKINAKVTIKNNGQASAGSSKIYYYLGSSGGSASTGPTTIYKSIQEGSISSLSINESKNDIIGNWITGGWTIPSDVVPETYCIWVKADSSSQIDEGNAGGENNNWGSSTSFTIAAPKPDLVISDIKMNDLTSLPSVNTGDTVSLDFYGNNITPDTNSKMNIEMKAWWGTSQNSMTNPICTEIFAWGELDGLSYNENEETTYSWTIPQLAPGTYWITAKIDTDNKQNDEPNEENNLLSESFTILAPDLEVQSLVATPNVVQPGDDIEIDAVVINTDHGNASQSKIAYFWGPTEGSRQETIGFGDVPNSGVLSYMQTESDSPTAWLQPNFVIPNTNAGTYYITAVVDYVQNDPDGIILESDEGNNELSIPITVKQKVTSVSWSKSEVEAGDYVTISITGIGLSGTIPLKLYEDDDGSPTEMGVTINVPVSGTSGSTQWQADWNKDTGIVLDADPEYVLKYATDNITSGELKVTDKTAPKNPTNLKATKSSIDDNTYVFSWTHSLKDEPSNELGSGFDQFILYVDGNEVFKGKDTQVTVGNMNGGEHVWSIATQDIRGNVNKINGSNFFVVGLSGVKNMTTTVFDFLEDQRLKCEQDMVHPMAGIGISADADLFAYALAAIPALIPVMAPIAATLDLFNTKVDINAYIDLADVFGWTDDSDDGFVTVQITAGGSLFNSPGLKLGFHGSISYAKVENFKYGEATDLTEFKIVSVSGISGSYVGMASFDASGDTDFNINYWSTGSGSISAVKFQGTLLRLDISKDIIKSVFASSPMFSLFNTVFINPLESKGFTFGNANGNLTLTELLLNRICKPNEISNFIRFADDAQGEFSGFDGGFDANDNGIGDGYYPHYQPEWLGGPPAKSPFLSKIYIENTGYVTNDYFVKLREKPNNWFIGSYDGWWPTAWDTKYDISDIPPNSNGFTSWLIGPQSNASSATAVFDLYHDVLGPVNEYISSSTISLVVGEPPSISGIPDQSIMEDSSNNKTVDLWSYSNINNTSNPLTFMVDYTNENNCKINIINNRYLTFESMNNFNGSIDVSVSANDGIFTDVDLFSLTVMPVNDAPEVPYMSSPPIEISEDPFQPYSGTVMATDVDGDALKYYASQPQHGTVNMNSNGTFTYKPNDNYFGDDSFAYWANDGTLNSENGTIAIHVSSINDNPGSANMSIDADETGEPALIDLAGTDVESTNQLTATIITWPTKGTLTPIDGKRYQYVVNNNQNGSDSFKYKVNDPDGGVSNEAIVSITIKAVNQKPIAQGQAISVDEDGEIEIELMATDTETAAGSLIYQVVKPQHGTLTSLGGIHYRYVPAQDYYGQDGFTFTATDNGDPVGSNNDIQASNPATISITINPVIDPPIADDGDTIVEENTLTNGVVTGSDVDGDSLIYSIVLPPEHGTVSMEPDGAFTYTPDEGFSGVDNFTFIVNDGSQNSLEEGTTEIIVGHQYIINPKQNFSFYDANNDFVTVTFTGPAGSSMEIIKSDKSDIARLTLNGTDNKSSLKITTKGKGIETAIKEMVVNGDLKSLQAKTTDITGSINATGCVGSILLDDITDGANVTTGTSPGDKGITFSVDRVGDEVDIVIGGGIKSFMAVGDISGSITAEGVISKITSKTGDITGSIRSGREIGTIQAFDLNGAVISSANNVKQVVAKGNIFDSWIFAGYDIGCDCAFGLQETGGGDLLSSGDVKSVTAKGTFARSYIVAGTLPNTSLTSYLPGVGQTASTGYIGKVKFGNINYNDANDYFGLFAATEIKPFKIGKNLAVSKGMFVV